ncbi:hypothetical protein ACGFNU_37710 [Spirillospora sp. NPDC048911]|uniref:hypothetical protein n=1 Tax=Spirillospora sp. NPDC048911 TaxID=3364527 RepID=UPI00371575DC
MSLSVCSGVVSPDGGVPGDAVMFTMSYVNRDGMALGIAVQAHRDDPAGLTMAERTVREWGAALRSRRLVVADTAPLCWGGARALDMISKAVARGSGPVYVLGRPVAGPSVADGLRRAGAVFADDPDTIPDGAQVVIPAHGAGTRAHAAARGWKVVDATCPLVSAAHTDASVYADRGDTVALIGRQEHAALPALAEQAGDAGRVVQTVADARALPVPDAERLSFVVEPGMPVEEAMPIVTALRDRYPRLAGHHLDVLCEAASDRSETVAAIASAGDLTLIVTGDTGDTDTRAVHARASRAAQTTGARVRVVTGLSGLRPEDLATATTIGLIATLTAPEGLDRQVIHALSGLGPLSVRRRGMRTRPDGTGTVTFDRHHDARHHDVHSEVPAQV